MRVEHIGMVLVLAGLGALPGCVGDNRAAPASGTVQGVQKGGDERTGEYTGAANWWKPAPDHTDEWSWAQIAGVAADNPDRIIVGVRGDRNAAGEARPNSSNYIVVVDGNGDIIERWTQWDTMLAFPHHVYISPYDPERHVWVVERGNRDKGIHEQILKFTNDGSELVMRLLDPSPVQTREEVRANENPGPLDFGQASDMAFLPDGSFLVSDGYTNSRIIKYDADGEYVMEWGELGTGPGQFDLVHGVDVDRNGRVYVADRGNSRIQVFTSNGEYVEEWPDVFFPVDLHIDENDAVWVVSAALNRFLKYNMNGELQYHWGTFGMTARGFGPLGTPERWRGALGLPGSANPPGGVAQPHQIDVDQEGNVYVASYAGPWVNKLTPRPGADPTKLIARHLGLED